ncbi:NAD(P)-binding protein [Pseudohyphozyma bogoriensis]|nr:NAD(P)-binding protein [Pseudohyphozyma bogoriensis]
MSPASNVNILILGAAGYIGGTVLTDLLKSHRPSGITALVRTPAQSTLLQPLGINTVLGSMEDVPLLRVLVARAGVVLNFAVPFGGGDASIQALVDGLESRVEKGGVKPVLIQTSGSGTVLYGEGGVAGTDVWTDEDYARWNALPDEAYFHTGNKIIAAAALRGKISAYILMSPTVYGQGTGPGNKLSLQLPAYERYAKRTGGAAFIGEGNNIWGNVHVKDLSTLYLLLMNHALANPTKTTASSSSRGWENLIYAGAAQHTWGPVIKTLGDLLYARGEVERPSAVGIRDSDGDMFMFGGNSFLAISKKAKALGFKPRQKTIIATLQEELPAPPKVAGKHTRRHWWSFRPSWIKRSKRTQVVA